MISSQRQIGRPNMESSAGIGVLDLSTGAWVFSTLDNECRLFLQNRYIVYVAFITYLFALLTGLLQRPCMLIVDTYGQYTLISFAC